MGLLLEWLFFLLSTLNWLGLICLVSSCVLVILFVIILLRSDCDLSLKAYEKLGKKPSKALYGKVVWITGASSGIGEDLSYTLAECGAKLILSARREKHLRKVLEKCKELSPKAMKETHMVLPLDLLNTDHHRDYAVEVLQEFGRIDILVNNAGRSQRAEAKETLLDVDRAVLELNTIGTISMTKVVLPHMLEQKDGCIITVISSVAGKMGAPGSASYSASKHALQGYFDTLRMELADTGVGVLNVCPGPVDTSFMRDLFGKELLEKQKEEDRKVSFLEKLGPMPSLNGEVCEVLKQGTSKRLKDTKKAEEESSNDAENRVPNSNRLDGKRCADLIAVAMANRLEEVWISKQPILLFTYISQYFPTLFRWLGKREGNKRLKAIKSGKQNIDGNFFR